MHYVTLAPFLFLVIAGSGFTDSLKAATVGCGLGSVPKPPLLNPQNGHYYWSCYGLDDENRVLSWHAAQEAAASLSFQGVPGHLATITSAKENAFLTENLPPGYNFEGWIGATDAEVEGEWRWAVGPEAGELFWLGGPDGMEITFADWHAGSGEPNNQAAEDYAMMGWRSNDWNDLPANDTVWHQGFVVEFSVPEPSGYALALFGATALIGWQFRERKFRAWGRYTEKQYGKIETAGASRTLVVR